MHSRTYIRIDWTELDGDDEAGGQAVHEEEEE